MAKLLDASVLSYAQQNEVCDAMDKVLATFGLELYDWGGGARLVPSVGTLNNSEVRPLMFALMGEENV